MILTYLFAEVPNRFVILIENDTDFVHQSYLFCIVAIQFCRAGIDVRKQPQNVLSSNRLSGSSGSSGRHCECGGMNALLLCVVLFGKMAHTREEDFGNLYPNSPSGGQSIIIGIRFGPSLIASALSGKQLCTANNLSFHNSGKNLQYSGKKENSERKLPSFQTREELVFPTKSKEEFHDFDRVLLTKTMSCTSQDNLLSPKA
jgi:hypothetical protein